MPPCFLFPSFSLSTYYGYALLIYAPPSFSLSLSPVVARYEKERGKKFFSRVFPPTSLRFVSFRFVPSISRLSSPLRAVPLQPATISLRRITFGGYSIGGQSKPTQQPALRDYLLSDRIHTHTHVRARMRVATPPIIRVFVARGMKTRARAADAHAMDTRSSIGSVSLLCALSVFFHCVAVYSYSSFPLSLSWLLRLVCSSLSPCMRVFASLAARRQRSAATARTTSFILSSLPAMPRVTREPVAVAVCSPR